MGTVISHCNIRTDWCSRTDSVSAIRVQDNEVFCGHCGSKMASAGATVTLIDITCDSDVSTWFSREINELIHRCGKNIVTKAANSLLVSMMGDNYRTTSVS